MTKNKWLTISISVLSIYIVWILASAMRYEPIVEEQIFSPAEGFFAPDFTLNTIDGESFTLSEHLGKPILLTIWASWCSPCKAEMPDFNTVYEEMQDDVLVVGVNVTNQDNLRDVITFLDQNEIAFPILLDESGKVSRLYQLQGLPMTFLINQEGLIEARIVGGPIPASSVRASFGQLLQEGENVSGH
jgi:peroxiredoxin